MRRHRYSNPGLAYALVFSLFASLVTVGNLVASSPAQAAVRNPIPANQFEEITYDFTEADAIFAYFTSDLGGGRICIVPATQAEPSGCGQSGRVIGATIGTGYTLIEARPEPGEYQLNTTDSQDNPIALSEVFTVSICDTCSRELTDQIVADVKATAGQLAERFEGMTATHALLEKFAGKAIGMRGIKQPVPAEDIVIDLTPPGATIVLVPSGGFFTVIDPLSYNIEKGLDLLKFVSTGAALMYRGIEADPPDSNFDVVATPEFPSGGTFSPTELQASIDGIGQQWGYLQAALHAIERFQGAQLAGDAEAQITQLEALDAMSTGAAAAIDDTVAALRSWSDVASADPELSLPVLTASELAELDPMYDRVRTIGFAPQEVAELQAAGFTAQDIEDLRTQFVYDVSLVTPGVAYPTVLDGVADDLEQHVDTWRALAHDARMVALRIGLDIPNQAPTASFTASPQSGGAPLDVTLRSTSRDSDGTIVQYRWSYGDGVVATGNVDEVEHTYNDPGNYTVTLTVTDDDGATNSASSTVSVDGQPTNEPPVASAQSVVTPMNTPIQITLSGTDPDGDALSYSISSPPSGSLTGTGAVRTYTPPTDQVGTDTFTFTVTDGQVTSAPATVTINIQQPTPTNEPPVASAQSVSTDEDTPVEVTLGGSDPNGDTLNYAVVDAPAHGVLSGTGQDLTYTPSAGYAGLDAFTFTVNDGSVSSTPATVSITVTASTPPTGEEWTIGGFSPARAGSSWTLYGERLTMTRGYLSDPANFGPGGIVLESYTIGPDLDTVTLASLQNYDVFFTGWIPSDSYSPAEKQALIDYVEGGGVLIATTDDIGHTMVDAFGLTQADGSGFPTANDITNPGHPIANGPFGAVTEFNQYLATGHYPTIPASAVEIGRNANGTTIAVIEPCELGAGSGAAIFVSDVDVFSEDGAVFNETLIKNIFAYATTVAGGPPVAVDDEAGTDEDTTVVVDVLGNDSDPDCDALTVSMGTEPVHGAVTVTDGMMRYVPTANFHGTDSFTYTVSAGGSSATATVTVTVAPVNDAPWADGQTVSTDEDSPVVVTLGGSDPDGETLAFTVVDAPAHGVLSGTGQNLTYTPNFNFAGADSFKVTANDGTVDSNVATVGVTVRPVNDPPTAADLLVSTPEGTPVGVTLMAADPDGDVLSYAVSVPPAHGTVSGTGASLTYTPAAGFSGSDSFTWTATDGPGGIVSSLVAITVTPVNVRPVANAQSVSTNENTPVEVTLDGSDADGDPLTYTVVNAPAHGVLSGAGRNLQYTPSPGYAGVDAFTFTVNDGSVSSTPATVSITVSTADVRITQEALLAKTNVEISGARSRVVGDIHANKNVVFNGSHGNVCGDITAGGSVRRPSTQSCGTTTTGAATVTIPTMADYVPPSSAVTHTLTGGRKLSGYTCGLVTGCVVRVTGRLEINGTVTGRVWFLVDKEVVITGDLRPTDANSKLRIYSKLSIEGSASNATISGLFLAEKEISLSGVGQTATGLFWGKSLVDMSGNSRRLRGAVISNGLLKLSGSDLSVTDDPTVIRF